MTSPDNEFIGLGGLKVSHSDGGNMARNGYLMNQQSRLDKQPAIYHGPAPVLGQKAVEKFSAPDEKIEQEVREDLTKRGIKPKARKSKPKNITNKELTDTVSNAVTGSVKQVKTKGRVSKQVSKDVETSDLN